MECIVAYLLLALFVDLALDLMAMEEGEEEAVWIKRRLWTDTPYDCGTRAVSILAPLTHQTASQNRNRFRRPRERKKRTGERPWPSLSSAPFSVWQLHTAILPVSGK